MKAVLRGWTELAPEVRDFELEVPSTSELAFVPGQFVSLSASIGGKTITRAYSISSAPSGNRFHLCLNRVSDGRLSPWLFDLPGGAEMDMKGPLGAFTLRPSGRDVLMVATGTGIAPFRSMIEYAVNNGGLPVKHTLIHGVRYEQSLLYRADFERWAARAANLDFRPTLSRPGEAWPGRTGHVQSHVFEAIGERRDFDIYLCGLKAMVDDMRARLKDLGFDRKQLIAEKFD